jgi:hypothetical protein
MKAVIAVFLSAILFLGMASIGAAAVGKKSATPYIEKETFVHYAKSSNHSRPIWDDTEDDFKLTLGGVKWTSTINYEVNPAGSGLDAEVVRSTLETSSETWDAETSFELFAPPTITTATAIGYDGTNRVVWRALPPGVIAVCYRWYNRATKEIREFDIVFNTYYDWGILDPLNPDNTKMDLQNIATHELGHNGLNDLRPPKDWALTMYAYTDYGETHKRTLGVGDILGIQKLYGE